MIDEDSLQEMCISYKKVIAEYAKKGTHSQRHVIWLLNILCCLDLYAPKVKHALIQSYKVEQYYRRLGAKGGYDDE